MRRVFTLGNLRWLCLSCHRIKTRQDRRLAKFLTACSLDWYGARRALHQHQEWIQSFVLPYSLGPAEGDALPRPQYPGNHDSVGTGRNVICDNNLYVVKELQMCQFECPGEGRVVNYWASSGVVF